MTIAIKLSSSTDANGNVIDFMRRQQKCVVYFDRTGLQLENRNES